jgi:hypothetical protein
MLKSALQRLLLYFQKRLAIRLWVREYRQTVFRQGTYLLKIREGRKKMSEQGDWIYDIVPEEQVNSMNYNASKIESNMQGGVSIVLSANNESAIDLCQNWKRCMQGETRSWIKISSFISGIVATIELHLDEEGINPYES